MDTGFGMTTDRVNRSFFLLKKEKPSCKVYSAVGPQLYPSLENQDGWLSATGHTSRVGIQ